MMKKLCELVACEYDIPIEHIDDDSRTKQANTLFFAIRGDTVDGHKYAADAVKNGAVAVVAERELNLPVPTIVVRDSAEAMNHALNEFYGRPLDSLKLIGVTGTDGKTTLSSIIYQLLGNFAVCGCIGTKLIECPGFSEEHHLTTPLPTDLFRALAKMRDCGCEYVVLEVSSQRLSTRRMEGFSFVASIFTNLYREHLDTHGTIENYALAKARLFEMTRPDGVCLVNDDDDYAYIIKKHCAGRLITFGARADDDLRYSEVRAGENRLSFELDGVLGHRHIESNLPGAFNAANLTSAYGCLTSLGFGLDELVEHSKNLRHISARQDMLELGQDYKILIDYAHTGNALSRLIDYARSIATGRVIVVLGTAGERFLGRKIDLGKVVVEKADWVIFTIENPRTEDPLDLVYQMLTEADTERGNFDIVLDRREAIALALDQARAGDIVMITGKGANGGCLIDRKSLDYPSDEQLVREHLKK